MGFQEKSKRGRERIKLTLPARVACRESAEHEWVEVTRLKDVTPFGASFTLTRPTEPGRLLHLSLPMPRQLRCFDHVEDQYRVWALVRSVRPATPRGEAGAGGGPHVYEVGVAFTGKHPPESYRQNPATRYEVGRMSPDGGLWSLRERAEGGASSGHRSDKTRLQMAVPVVVEALGEEGAGPPC